MWWIIATLILVGILLMLVETLLTPGVGIAGALSLASLTAACWYAFTNMGRTAGIIITLCVVAFVLVMLIIILRSKTWKKLELNTEIKSQVNLESEAVKAGDRGTALTRIAPMGTADFGSVSCEVKSHDNTMIAAGTLLECVKVEDNKVIVKPVNE